MRPATPALWRNRVAALVCAAAMAFASPAHAQTAPKTAPAPPAAHGLQADFDAASTAAEAHHCDEAETVFARLASDPRVKPGSLPWGMIALRRGLCAIERGQREQGEAWVRAGLPVVEQAGPDMVADASLGWLGLARLAARRYDHDGAVAAYRHLLALPGQQDRVDALIGLAVITTFDGDGVAFPLTDRALAIVATLPAGRDRAHAEAAIDTVRARILMNLGRYVEASQAAEHALALSGGLTSRVTLSDVSLRADAAEAALLKGNVDRARELLAYTGEGRIAQSPFASAKVLGTPACDEAVGLRPTDSAVVEFAISDDGTVTDAQTVFTRGDYATARVFAEAVRRWAWQPETVAKLPPFYRALIRAELRCSKTGGGLPGADVPFRQRIARWAAPLATANGMPMHLGSDRAGALRRKAETLAAAGDSVGAGTLLMLALGSDPVARASQLADADRAITLLATADAAHRASAAALRAMVMKSQNDARSLYKPGMYEAGETGLLNAAESSDIAIDALAQDTLRLIAVLGHSRGSYSDRELAALHLVAEDARLDAGSPLRQVALLRLASLAARDGRRSEAESLFARTGLGESQCALIGDIPRLRSSGSDSDYPVDALRMGFEGWVSEEFDIAADGHPVAPRAVIAYPPFVFVEGATALVKHIRFDPSFRPNGSLACSAKTETIKFDIPANH